MPSWGTAGKEELVIDSVGLDCGAVRGFGEGEEASRLRFGVVSLLLTG
jgi:hypothetical protein